MASKHARMWSHRVQNLVLPIPTMDHIARWLDDSHIIQRLTLSFRPANHTRLNRNNYRDQKRSFHGLGGKEEAMNQPQPPLPAAASRARRQVGMIAVGGTGGPGHSAAAPAPLPQPRRPQQLLDIKVMANGGVGGADDDRRGRLSPPPQYKSAPALPTPTTCASVASLDDSYVLLPLLDGCTGFPP